MAPSLVLDNVSDFSPHPVSNQTVPPSDQKILLLAPPSLSSHPEALNGVLAAHDRHATDLQMLDRLSVGLVSLPESLYDLVLILTDPDGTRRESSKLLSRSVLSQVVLSLKFGGHVQSQDGSFANDADSEERRETILAGLVYDGARGMTKPSIDATQSVPLRRKPKQAKTNGTDGAAQNKPIQQANPAQATRIDQTQLGAAQPAGVGFVDFSDEFGDPAEDDDDELIDEDTLLDGDDLTSPIVQPPECRPKSGKRRRACKDCTCGLKEKIELEDSNKRSKADNDLNTLKLGADDLAEVDFTVQGKVGSCGNCSLGDAFRCDGCPYIGLPAFKPGDEVKLLNNDVQL